MIKNIRRCGHFECPVSLCFSNTYLEEKEKDIVTCTECYLLSRRDGEFKIAADFIKCYITMYTDRTIHTHTHTYIHVYI